MTALVRNLNPSALILPLNNTSLIQFGPKGSPTKDDYQHVTDEVVEMIEFRNAVSRGYVSIVPEEEAEVVNEAQQAADIVNAQRREDVQAALMRDVVRTQDKDLVGEVCKGPGPDSRPNRPCGVSIIRRAVQTKEEPPLCDTHKSLSGEFVYNETYSDGNDGDLPGTVRKEWKRVTIVR